MFENGLGVYRPLYSKRNISSRLSQSGNESAIGKESLLRRNIALTTMMMLVFVMGLLAYLVLRREPLPFNDFRISSMIAISFSLVCIVLLKSLLRLPVFSFPVIFAGVTFVFTLSGFFMVPLDGWYAFKNYIMIDEASIKQGLPIVLLAFASLLFGALFTIVKDARRRREIEYPKEITRTIRSIGLIIYVLSLVFISVWTVLGSGINLAFTGGYEEFVTHRTQNLLPYQVAAPYAWFLPWSCLILIGTSQTRRQDTSTFILIGIGILIYLLTGDRNVPSSLIVMLICARYLWKRPFKFWQIALGIFILIILVSSLDALRKLPIRDWTQETISQTIASESFGSTNNPSGSGISTDFRTPFGWLFANTSNSYQTLMGAVRLIPEVEPFRYGRDYLASLFIAVPFLPSSGIIDVSEHPTSWITNRLFPGTITGLGFLQVGEAYINFGAAGVAGLFALLGWFLTRLWGHLAAGKLNPQLLAYSLIIMNGLLVWIRNDSSNLGRTFIWGWLIVYAIPYLLLRSRKFG